MNEDEFRGRTGPQFMAAPGSHIEAPDFREAQPSFDLAKAMDNGGKCLAGDRPARIVCTDYKNEWPLIVVIDEGGTECTRIYPKSGRHLDGTNDLRNLPEEKTVKVTLWENDKGQLAVTTGGQTVQVVGGIDYMFNRYGTAEVTFRKGE